MFRKLLGKRNISMPFDLTPDQDEYLADAIQIYNQSQKNYGERFGFTKHDEWGFDQAKGEFIFKDEGEVTVTADGQIIGSFSASDSTWEWAWNNPHVDAGMKKSSLLVKEYGKNEGLVYLCEGILSLPDENYATYLAAVGQKVSGSEAVYRGVMGDLSIFLLLNNFEGKSG
jgi:hypothetical protein